MAYQSPPIYNLCRQRQAGIYGLLAGCADEYETEWLHLSAGGSVSLAGLFGQEGLSGPEYDRMFVDLLRQVGEEVRDSRSGYDRGAAMRAAEACRQRGNAAIQSGDNEAAVVAYDEAAALLGPFEEDS